MRGRRISAISAFFRSPSARLVFDINDFDETAIGPWEWDLKRLAASVRSADAPTKSGEGPSRRRGPVRTHLPHTHEVVLEMDYLDAWYEHLDVEETLDPSRPPVPNAAVCCAGGGMKALLKDNDAAAAKLCRYEASSGSNQSPELVPINQLDDYADLDALQARIDAVRELPAFPVRRSPLGVRSFALSGCGPQGGGRGLGGPARVDVGVDRA